MSTGSLRIKLVHEKAQLPKRGSAQAAGYDLMSVEEIEIGPNEQALVSTGISIELPQATPPDAYYARIAPRSGLSVNHRINTGAGVIDADYRGVLRVVLINNSSKVFKINVGDKIAQLIIEKIILPPVLQVDSLSETDRGTSGFGSTGVSSPAIPKTSGDFSKVTKGLADLFSTTQIDVSHDLLHMYKVYGHAKKAVDVETPPLSPENKEAVELAALLHEADDRKFFSDNNEYANARKILISAGYDSGMIELVISMISLVSCAKNRNSSVDQKWMLIPRWADRLEAVGYIGLYRTYKYTTHTGRPLFVDDTPRCKTEDELWKVATPERFAAYQGNSRSMIDHFYDKLLHINSNDIPNSYLKGIMDNRRKIMVDFVLKFGNTGTLNETELENCASKDDD